MRIIDNETGESPVLRSGDEVRWSSRLVCDGDVVTVIPDALTADGDEALVAQVRRIPSTTREEKE